MLTHKPPNHYIAPSTFLSTTFPPKQPRRLNLVGSTYEVQPTRLFWGSFTPPTSFFKTIRITPAVTTNRRGTLHVPE